MLEVYVLQIIFENTFVSHITVDMWAVGNMFISFIITFINFSDYAHTVRCIAT